MPGAGPIATRRRAGSLPDVQALDRRGGCSMSAEKLLTAEQVADIVGMTPDYVYSLSRRGKIPVITFGRQRRYRRESIEQWLSELERGSVAPDHRNGRAAR